MPTDFGTRLRTAREGRGLTLRQIAAVTKITVSSLEALEANDPSRLPGGIFSRAFVKAYAQEVGLDPAATVREFLETFAQEVEPPPAVVESGAAMSSAPARWVGPAMAIVVLVGASLVGLRFLGAPSSWRGQVPAGTASPAAVAPLPVSPAPPPPPGLPTPGDPPEPGGSMVLPATAASIDSTPALHASASLGGDGLMRLSFRPQGGPCWVEVVADGKMELSREIGAGETETRAARDAFEIKVGDAGRCTYTLNDRPGRPFGPAGKVVRVRIDRASLATFVQGS